MIWGIFAIISFQLVDTFYVGLLGTAELAALSFTFPLNYTIFSVTIGFGIAMSSVLSRVIGAGDEDSEKRIATVA
ncbi:MAG TPA: MATE family efflux transporter [Alphaproteobacteria bacterium]|nr:MATE family efflux transporter [Alphaproteobacteria bacterium]